MRLGQFARKYDIRVQDLISYLENDAKEEIHSNTKLSDKVESDILDFFGIDVEVQKELPIIEDEPEIASESKKKESQESVVMSEPVTEKEPEWDAEDSEYGVRTDKAPAYPETPLDDIASVEGEIAESTEQTLKEELEPNDDKPKEKEAIKEDEVIQTDQLLEMLESEESPMGLDKIKLIKAPKKELAGLKVLGKVNLPEPKKKTEAKNEETENSNQRRSRPQISDEEKEKRRLKAKQKQEAYEARQEKRRKEQEARKLKELKASHYQQKLQKPEVKKQKQTVKRTSEPFEHKAEPSKRQEPKTWLGRWWRWMNT
ncbi:hypothetical protein [Ekhidna sp.]|uniref:hypothetical protein n=1 Tax=Ekhidna sp. TaxID=2608089 RepID=UPI0032EDE7A1